MLRLNDVVGFFCFLLCVHGENDYVDVAAGEDNRKIGTGQNEGYIRGSARRLY